MPNYKYLHRINRDETWRYRFSVGGREYSGNTGIKDARKASRKAVKIHDSLIGVDTIQSVLDKKRDHLIGVAKVRLADSWNAFNEDYELLELPRRQVIRVSNQWNSFVDWMAYHHPKVVYLHEVTEGQAQSYWRRIRREGRWYPDRIKGLSSQTKNEYLKTAKRLFKALRKKASITENPFEEIEMLDNDEVSREDFKPADLKLINDNAEGWIRYLYMVGLNTGMREGDMCMLKWSNIDLDSDPAWINNVKCMKTKHSSRVTIDVPITPLLKEYLQSLPREKGQIYVHPRLAHQYRTDAGKIGMGFTAFLKGLGIETDVKVEGRDKPAKLRDVHSFRHSFIYIAGMHKIPISIVQSLVGHMTESMTLRYNNHADKMAKAKHFQGLDFLDAPKDDVTVTPEQVATLQAEKATMAARMEAAVSKLERIGDLLEYVEDFGEFKTRVAKIVGPVDSEIVAYPIPIAQIAQ